MGTKKWTAVEYDLKKDVQKQVGKTEYVELPKTLWIDIELELDDEAFKIFSRDSVWIARLSEKSLAAAKGTVPDLAKAILVAEKAAKDLTTKEAEALEKKLNATIDKLMEDARKSMGGAAQKWIDDYLKANKELVKFRVRALAKIGVTVGAVAGGIALSGASMGALSPVAMIGLVKGCITVANELLKVGATVDMTMKKVQVSLKALKLIMLKAQKDPSVIGQIESRGIKVKAVAEIGLNMLSKATAIPLPSMKECDNQLDELRARISELQKKSHGLSEKVNAAMDSQEAWAKAFTKAKASLPIDKVRKVAESAKVSEKALNAVLETTFKVNESINKAEDLFETSRKTLDEMKDGIPKWVGHVDEVVSTAVDIVTGIDDAKTQLEKAFAVMSALAQTMADQKLA
jgi:hypothetical protein